MIGAQNETRCPPVPCCCTTQSAHAKASLPVSTKDGDLAARLSKQFMAQHLLSESESLSMTRASTLGRLAGSRRMLTLPCLPNTKRPINRMASKLQGNSSDDARAETSAGAYRHVDTGSSCAMMRRRTGR